MENNFLQTNCREKSNTHRSYNPLNEPTFDFYAKESDDHRQKQNSICNFLVGTFLILTWIQDP